MKLAVFSDLHLEFGLGHFMPFDLAADVYIIAGDFYDAYLVQDDAQIAARAEADDLANIIASRDQVLDWLAQLNGQGKPILFVLGNHEFYHGSPEEVRAGWRRLEAHFEHLHVLDNQVWRIGPVVFAGSTLFTDLGDNPVMREEAQWGGISDFCLIEGFTPEYMVSEHHSSTAWLRQTLSRYRREPGVQHVVAITHHAPTYRQLERWDKGSDLLNAMYASDMEALLQACQPSLWIHGHIHKSLDYRVGETRVICNPRGYYPRRVNPQFDTAFVLELPVVETGLLRRAQRWLAALLE